MADNEFLHDKDLVIIDYLTGYHPFMHEIRQRIPEESTNLFSYNPNQRRTPREVTAIAHIFPGIQIAHIGRLTDLALKMPNIRPFGDDEEQFEMLFSKVTGVDDINAELLLNMQRVKNLNFLSVPTVIVPHLYANLESSAQVEEIQLDRKRSLVTIANYIPQALSE